MVYELGSHFHTLDFDTPSGGGFIKNTLHGTGNTLSITEDLAKAFGTQNISQGSLSKKTCWVMCVLHVGNRDSGIVDTVVNDSIDRYRHWVFSQDL